ncbi:MAG: arginine--tRNA ligase [Bacteroidales bacterium]|nr:arginine--tRNA ligase [Bacteroidales bacterium]MBQ7873500.1 arginine--tRNA ligase [Clostridia bacterium]
MQNFKKLLSQRLLDAINIGFANPTITENDLIDMLEYPPDTTMGDIALPCFKLSRTLRRSPVQIAQIIAENLNDEAIKKAEPVNGYLNISISDSYLERVLNTDILTKGDSYGASDLGKGKTVVLDYSSPNVAKPFHIGHLGTTVIGHSLKKLHQFVGYDCVGINYLGDWGTQFGKMIVAYKKWGNRDEINAGGIDKLVELYVKFHHAAEEDPALNDEARAEFRKLELNDEENIALWKWFIEISVAEYKKTYGQLGIEFDSYKGESFYTDKMPAQVQKLRDMNLLKIDDGASIVDLEEYNMPPCLILKRDGSTLYPTRDIAAAVYRKQTYNFDKAIYVTSAGQSLHFAQWFKVVELMGYDWYDKLVHVPYGTVSINGAKLATRTGNVILLKDLFAQAIEKVAEIMEEKNPDLENKDKVAEAVGVGAIVFYYLSSNRIRDINFVLEDALSFDGNTGPYVQYTYARTCSLLEKAGDFKEDLDIIFTADEERELIKTLARFPEKVIEAIEAYEPSIITRYILDVAAAFNRFYHNCQILSANDEAVLNTRIKLTKATNFVLGNAFELICLKKTKKI